MQNHSKVSVRPSALSREELRIFEKESGAARQNVPAKTQIFGQGQAADAISYIIKGKVQITVVSKQGRGGMVGLVSEGGFVGEACLTGQPSISIPQQPSPTASCLRFPSNACSRSSKRTP